MNNEIAKNFGISCIDVQSVNSLDLRLAPEDGDIKYHTPVIDPQLTRWLLYLEQREEWDLRLQQLEVSNWIDRSTSEVMLRFMSYNAQFDILVMTEIWFFFSQSGHTWKDIVHSSLIVNPYRESWSIIVDAIFVLLQVRIFLIEVCELVGDMKRGKRSGITLRHSFRNYFNFWNVVDWISIVSAAMLIAIWIRTCVRTSHVADELSNVAATEYLILSGKASLSGFQLLEYQREVEELFGAFSAAQFYKNVFQVVAPLYPVVVLLRLCKAFDAQPRLAFVTRTLIAASSDLLHFAIVFFAIFLTFAVMGTALFGTESEEFSTFPRSFVSCFVIMLGEMDVERLWDTGRASAGIWLLSFQLLTALIMLNMLLAIIMDAYMEVNKSVSLKQGIGSQIQNLLQRWRQVKKKQRISLKEIEAGISEACMRHKPQIEATKIVPAHLVRSSTSSSQVHSWNGVHIMTVEKFQQSVPNLGQEQATQLLIDAVRNWRRECGTPTGLQEALHAISLMHGQLDSFIESVQSQYDTSLQSNQNSSDHPSQKPPISAGSGAHQTLLIPFTEPCQDSHLAHLATEVTEMKQQLTMLQKEQAIGFESLEQRLTRIQQEQAIGLESFEQRLTSIQREHVASLESIERKQADTLRLLNHLMQGSASSI